MSFDKILRQLRIEAGMTQAELAKKIGLKPSAVSMMENGKRKASFEVEESIADTFNVTLDDLRGINRGCYTGGLLPPPRMVKKPRLGVIACGEPFIAGEYFHDEYDLVPADIKCDFTLQCKGDSMIGDRIKDGDIVFIRAQPEVNNGQIAAVRIDREEVTLKHFYFRDGAIQLFPSNPAYDVIVVPPGTDFEIIGRVVGFMSEFK